MTQTAESILGFLSKLFEADVLRQSLIEATLGIALHLDSTQSNPEFNFYRYKYDKAMQQANLVKEVDFRVPVSPDRSGDEFLYVTLEQNDKLNAPIIAARYGQPQKIDVPTPQESMGTGITVTYVYLIGKREASFSFGPPPNEALLTIALARHRE